MNDDTAPAPHPTILRTGFEIRPADGPPIRGEVRVDTFGTAEVSEEAIEAALQEVFDFTPQGIREGLTRRTPIYRPTAAYGHFGRATEMTTTGQPVKLFPWEETSRVDDLRTAAKA